MAHISTSRTGQTRKTPADWLKFGQQVGEQTNRWARRGDIVAFVGPLACEVNPKTGKPVAAALFKPAIAEMEINTDEAFEEMDPAFIPDFTKRSTHLEFPAVAGAALHEAMHARHTRYSLPDLARLAHKEKNPYLADLVMWFEETRIERMGRRHYPRNRALMRACALKLSLKELPDAAALAAAGSMGISNLLLITAARVDADVLDPDDVASVVDTIRSEDVFGEELYDKLRTIWYKAQRLSCDTDFAPLVDCAREWLAALEEHGKPAPEPMTMVMISMAGPGTDGEEAGEDGEDGEEQDGEGSDGGEFKPMPGEGDSENERMMQGLLDDLEDAADETEVAAQSEAYAQGEQEAAEEEAKAASEAASEAASHKDEGAKLFAKTTGPGHGGGTRSRLHQKRKPTPKERTAAVTLSKLLDKARYRDRVVTTSRAIEPPGRLQARAAVQAAAYKAAGQSADVEMWKRKRRTHVEDPNLTVGILCDISGSMGGAMEPIAVTTWIVQEAARRIDAKVAAVYYGDSIFPVLKPGQHLSEVEIYTAPDSTEKFAGAFRGIDGALGLLTGQGARLLVIVSDCCYTGGEGAALKKWVDRCLRAGVGVVIYNPEDSDYYIKNYLPTPLPANVEVIASGSLTAVDLAQRVGTSAVKALERMGGRV